MAQQKVAFIGTGPDPDTPDWGTSAAMSYHHADAYAALENCSLVACADLVRDHAEAFADRFGIDRHDVYEDYMEMLRAVEPDIVSVCTPVPTHADIVIDCTESDALRAIHCEKPMADTFGDCRRMVSACADNDIQLTFNHQRRFSETYLEARRRITEGEIGTIERVEIGGKNLFDFGSHLIDVCNGLNDGRRPEWALCQVDYSVENVRYGSHNENQALAMWEYENGVHALLSTGDGTAAFDSLVRVRGTEGVLDLWPSGEHDLRVHRDGETTPEAVDCENDTRPIFGAIADVVSSLDGGTTPVLDAEDVLTANEIIFGCWESVRRRARVEFPLEIEDNPLQSMVESGALTPRSAEE
ncbi:Gfo/Idh/MocA family oxidoreductase [Haladaptatus sp. AB618]|uniref:Gfo/Idh/MocA family protein n=1 Tax=Haladaptatus sp. AB618 TaxID=2934173 RepID=UPI00209BBEAA|nr:Gfo/Idh/MocA family oxidoreductase [Haladaptatus sp. AB618]MCO8254958.1 Gfo/Idh/MocA family oxidoreductase [Haladaptatus sp. AB618]